MNESRITTNRTPRELLPYLSIEESKSVNTVTGYLHLRNPEKKIKIGATGSKEFKFIQCLFSPENFLSAKHKSVAQTRERVVEAMQATGEPHSNREGELGSEGAFAIVQKTIQSLKRKEVGKFLNFTFKENKIQMLVG